MLVNESILLVCIMYVIGGNLCVASLVNCKLRSRDIVFNWGGKALTGYLVYHGMYQWLRRIIEYFYKYRIFFV